MIYTYLVTVHHGPGHQSSTRYFIYKDKVLTKKERSLERETAGEDLWDEDYGRPIVKIQYVDSDVASRNKNIRLYIERARKRIIGSVKGLIIEAEGLGLHLTRQTLSETLEKIQAEISLANKG